MQHALAILLAGGAGERLFPLTQNTAKPAVPFGGAYRIVDFTLSNCVNSNIRRVFILTQYKALELTRHIREGWNIFSGELDEFIEVIPPMKRIHDGWYLGTADAVYQNIESILNEDAQYTLILSGDHIYKMDYNEMVSWHEEKGADITIATIQIRPDEASRFGVVEIDQEYRVVGFEEKPKHGHPVRSVFNPDMVSASMGVYVFNTRCLVNALIQDATDSLSSHDFAKDILPKLLTTRCRVAAYDFRDLNRKTVRYWRDVGTLDAYFDANMDLVRVTPEFNLYDEGWPVRTKLVQQPPAKFVFAHEGRRMGIAMDSIVSAGSIISGGRVTRSVLSPGVRVNSYCQVDSCILMSKSEVGRYSRIRRTIVPANVVLEESSVIGYDHDADRARGYTVTESGVVVVPPVREQYLG